MRSKTFLTACLASGALLWLAPGCAPKVLTSQQFPSAADMRPEPRPQLGIDALNSEAALDAYEIELEAWAERGWRAVGRICRWAVANGAKLEYRCPAPPPDG